MLNIQNWNSVEAERNDFKRLTAGGHKCVVKNVEQRNSKSGKPMLVIAFDIAGGDFDGYYMDLYAKNVEKAQKDGKQAKWPNGGIFYQLIDEEHLGRFKAVIEDFEASNPGFKFNLDEKSLMGKFFGGVFREEEYEATMAVLRLQYAAWLSARRRVLRTFLCQRRNALRLSRITMPLRTK
jgi:hypothetical protein